MFHESLNFLAADHTERPEIGVDTAAAGVQGWQLHRDQLDIFDGVPEVDRAAGEVPGRLPLPGLRLGDVAAVAKIIEEAVQVAVDVRLSRQSSQT